MAPGVRLGAYEVISIIGAGGMGEVYRARDTRLGRDVAIKVLPDAFINDAERLARFKREAQMLASLNHPHIAAIYGLEQESSVTALVLELVEGPTLADRIAQGPIPIDEALPIAMQIAEAIEAAHEQGIIHRDLKPANIKLTHDSRVKVLDFGLAKLSNPADGGGSVRLQADLSTSPTITSPALATHNGIILGTAAYMSPEQAKGKPVDKRADVWAFACVLYEMLTGRRAFEGEDVSDTLAAILRGEPDWKLVPLDVPAGIATLMKRCLEKDRRRRIGDIAVALFVLNEPALIEPKAATARIPTARGRNRERVFWAALFLVSAATAAYFALRPPPSTDPMRRLSVALPEGANVSHLALSPDGRRLALTMAGGQRSQIWLRSLDTPDLQPLSGTAGARAPFWSPDSRSIGFFADGKLRVIPATGGPPQELCDSTGLGGGGTWNRDGVILFGIAVGNRALRRVNASGGACTDVTKPEGAGHSFPEFLPDGEHFLYVAGGGDPAKRGVYLASLADASGRRLLSDFSNAIFSSSPTKKGPGHLLFLREGTLMAQPFDADTLDTTGDVFAVVTGASTSSSASQMAASVSADGVLVYLANRSDASQRRWIDRTGKELGSEGSEAVQQGVVLSPNEQFMLFGRDGNSWLRDLVRHVDTPFHERVGPGVWSADSSYIISGDRDGRLIGKHIATGKEEELSPAGTNKSTSDWSRDGQFLVYTEVHPKTQADIWVITDPLNTSKARKAAPYIVTPFLESQAQLSPDGRWAAYVSDESGQFAVYVSRFPLGGGKVRISPADGREPRWRGDGRELYYLVAGGGGFRLMATPVESGATEVRVGEATALFDIRIRNFFPQNNVFQYTPAMNGQRFLVNDVASDEDATLNVVTNWHQLVKTRD